MLRRVTVSTLFAAVTAAFLAFGLVGCGDDNPAKNDTYKLTTSVNPSAGGSIQLTPPGGSYKAGDTVLLVAVPADGYEFTSWTGATATAVASAASVVMTGNKTVTANFTKTDDGGDSTGTGGNGDGLVLGENEAWVSETMECDPEDDEEICVPFGIGFIFKENGDLITLINFGGIWMGGGGQTYSVNGSILTVVDEETGEASSGPFSISGNTLTLFDPDYPEDDVILEKKSGITYIDLSGFGGNLEMMSKSPAAKKLPKSLGKALAKAAK
jgi:hypothetical protein